MFLFKKTPMWISGTTFKSTHQKKLILIIMQENPSHLKLQLLVLSPPPPIFVDSNVTTHNKEIKKEDKEWQ